MVRWLTRADVEALTLSPARSLELADQALRWLAGGEAEVPAKFGIHPPHGRHMHAMPAYVKPLELAGIKWLGDYPANRAHGLPTVVSLIVLNDARTSLPLAIMDGNWITALRTAAATAVSLRACARPDVRAVAMIGTGLEARSHFRLLPEIFPRLEAIRVAGRTREAAERFIADYGDAIRAKVVAAGERESAVRNAEVIITVTNANTTRLLEPEWLASGVTIAVVDGAGKETGILPLVERHIVDDRAPFEADAIAGRFPDGFPPIDAQIGDVLLGRAQGRTSPSELVLVNNLGNAVLDVVFAAEIFKLAKARSIGIDLEL